MFESFGKSHVGLVRAQNEDSFACEPAVGLWVVADGVGGQNHGEFASQLAVNTIKSKVQQGSSLSSAIHAANAAIVTEVEQRPEYRGMATTVVAVKFKGNCYEIGWVGDSRAYLFSGNNLVKLTKDHNQAQILVDTGELTEEQAEHHPSQHVLTQALGLNSGVEIGHLEGVLLPEQVMLLCSDGLSGEVDKKEMESLLQRKTNLENLALELEARALEAGGSDNITIALLKLKESYKGPISKTTTEANFERSVAKKQTAASEKSRTLKSRNALAAYFAAGILVALILVAVLSHLK